MTITLTVNIQISAYFDSINKIPDMLLTAHQLGMAGITLTDHECLCGHLKWLKAEEQLKKEGKLPENFKAALGNEIYLVGDRNNIEKYWHYILIAKNNAGHRALRELSSIAWYHGFNSRGMMRVPTQMDELEAIVKKYPNSLIATNGCLGGIIGNRVIALSKAEQKENNENEIYSLKKDINDFILWNKKLFGDDFYCEIAAGQSSDQRKFNERIKSIAKAYDLKIVIGSDAHYLTAKERPLHKAYLNSKEGEREVDQFYWDAHMMDNDEAYENLKDFYSEDEFIQICNNSMEIYNKIEGYNLCHKPIIPETEVKEYPILEEYRNIDLKRYPVIKKILKGNIQERYWINQCLTNLYEKKLVNQDYLERLEIEADVIYTIGEKIDDCLFKYFNTFQSLIDIFWDCGSIIPPGRGSSVCYLSNYLMGITQLDPVKLDLPYFRFLNKERVELPD